jgi:hypothetical protein
MREIVFETRYDRGTGEKKKTKEEEKKNRRREGKKKGDLCLYTEEKKNICRITVTLLHRRQHRHRESPTPPTLSAGLLPPLSFFFFISPYLYYSAKWRVKSELIHYPLFICNVSSGEHLHVYWAEQHRPRPKWLGLVRHSPKKIQKKKTTKNPFEKFMIFPRMFLLILLKIGLYFYTIKIQIRY